MNDIAFDDANTSGDVALLTFYEHSDVGELARMLRMRLNRHELAKMIRTLEGVRFALDAKAGE